MNNRELFIKIRTELDTTLTRLILYCIYELPFPLGVNKIAAVLKGRKSSFNIQYELNNLETFAILNSYNNNTIKAFLDTVSNYGLIESETVSTFNMPVLQLTKLGMDLLNGESDLYVDLLEEHIDKEIVKLTDEEEEIFDQLKKWRVTRSKELDVPAFYVFGDTILQQIAIDKPVTNEELLTLKGIGPNKARQYGKEIIKLIGGSQTFRKERKTDLSEAKLTFYESVRLTTGSKITLQETLVSIKDNTYRDVITLGRNALEIGDMAQYEDVKSHLPAVTFSGYFEGAHKAENIKKYTNLIIVDIDDVTKVQALKIRKKVSNNRHTLAIWLSPSARGVKILIKIDGNPKVHKHWFNSVMYYLEEEFELEIDKSGSDVSRLCYLSHDPDIYINPDSEVFRIEYKPPKIEHPKAKNLQKLNFGGTDEEMMGMILNYLQSAYKSITYDQEHWYKWDMVLQIHSPRKWERIIFCSCVD